MNNEDIKHAIRGFLYMNTPLRVMGSHGWDTVYIQVTRQVASRVSFRILDQIEDEIWKPKK